MGIVPPTKLFHNATQQSRRDARGRRFIPARVIDSTQLNRAGAAYVRKHSNGQPTSFSWDTLQLLTKIYCRTFDNAGFKIFGY